MLVQFARVGDNTTTGGTVLTGCDKQTAFGKQISTIGDQASCPKCGHTGIIVEGSSMVSIFGKAVAIDGSLIACGCPLGTNKIVTIPIPYAPTTTVDMCLLSATQSQAVDLAGMTIQAVQEWFQCQNLQRLTALNVSKF